MADDQKANQRSEELASAVAAVKKNPADGSRWDRVDELLESVQRPEEVSGVFTSVLGKHPELLVDVGKRGVRFYETWYGEASLELAGWLKHLLKLDPAAQWAFERLTVAHTVGERFAELLDAYDAAIEASDQTTRRMRLLEEAAQVAKDFANQADRAIGYLLRLHALDPENAGLAAGLERLLERQERWEDLVALWQSRLSLQSPKQAQQARVRMASVYLDKLARYSDAFAQCKGVLAEAPEHAGALQLLERLLASREADTPLRREALHMLKQRHLENNKPDEIVRVLELGLGYAADAERKALLRELVARLSEAGQDARASCHQATLFVHEPLVRERDTLSLLCDRTRDPGLYADSLQKAAEQAADPALSAELLLEAGRTVSVAMGDEARGIALYQRVLESKAPAQFITEAGRRMVPLLERAGRDADVLEILSRVGLLEENDQARRALLGKAATLAQKLGDTTRAEQAWLLRLQQDAQDIEALDALITASAEAQKWPMLVSLLEQRIKAPAAAERRRQDLVWLASTQSDRLDNANAAIEVWRTIQDSFGEDTETVTALTDLLSKTERWPELAEVLQQAAARQVARFTELQTKLGDAYRKKLGKQELAAERYRAALHIDPRSEAALQGQHALLDDERCKPIAAQSLADAYARTDDFPKALGLLEVRLSLALSATAQAAILLDAAALYEERVKDPRAELDCLRRAFALCAEDRATEKKIRRRAESLSAWDAVVATYRETIARLPENSPRVAELRFEEGKTLHEQLADREGALLAYAAACAIAPQRTEFVAAAVKIAAELSLWEVAASHVLSASAARPEQTGELLLLLESAATSGKAFDALTEALGAALTTSRSLPAKLQRLFYAQLGRWHRDQRKDERAAESAIQLAVRAESADAALLEELAALQRSAPGPALCATLETIFELAQSDLDPLCEAGEIAGALPDPAARLALLQRLYDRASDLLRRELPASGKTTALQGLRFSLDQLVALWIEINQPKRALQLLLGAAALPIDAQDRRADLHRAAALAASGLKDDAQAMALYRDLLAVNPADRVAISELCKLYTSGQRLPELIALKQAELKLEREPERQLALRLELAANLGELEARDARAQALLDNLRARPGHAPSLAAVSALFTAQRRHDELGQLLRKQAQQLARQAEPSRASELLMQAASIYEGQPGQADVAIATYRELYELEPTGAATAALARLHAVRGEHVQAAKWLELRLGTAPPDTRAVTSVELAQALLEAGDRGRARAYLEQALLDTPVLERARALLSELYREDGAFQPLADLLAASARVESDAGKRLALLREAAAIYDQQLQAPERAIDALAQAAKLAPDDRELGIKLADTLASAGRLQPASAAFEQLIESFGRKRSPQRAELHYRLARVLKAAGDVPRAFEELDTATKMDPGHVPAMYLLAEVSQEQGDLDRAERTYRGLLMLVRRQKSDAEQTLFPSEIFYALSTIASSRGQASQADELLESAMEAATQHPVEARRFQELLRKRGQLDLLMKVLDAREKHAQSETEEAEILQARAEVLADGLGQHPKALDLLLKALALLPDHDALHERVRGLALGLDQLDGYLGRLVQLADDATRKRDAKGRRLAAKLTLRQGEAIEYGLGDLDRALGLYAKVEASGELLVDAWLAMARVAGTRGDKNEQRRVLLQISEAGPEVPTEQRSMASWALAELELFSDAWRDAGVLTLERALSAATHYDRAKAVVRSAVLVAPEHAALGAAFERVARASRDPLMLLEHFERFLQNKDAGLPSLREGIELALSLGEEKRAQALLERAVSLSLEPEQATWVHARLSECRRRSGDVTGALRSLEHALKTASEDESERLSRVLAQLAEGDGGDLEVAVSAYTRLWKADATDRSLWEPLLTVYRRIGDRKRFERFAKQCLEDLISPADRAEVELTRAKFLIESSGDDRAAVPALKAVLEHEPGHGQATDMLTEIFQKHGDNDELALLLLTHFDRARDAENLPAIAELGLRIGQLYGQARREAAVDIYRCALQWMPEHRELLRALLSVLAPDGDERERADVMRALLKVESGSEAARLSLALSALWDHLNEVELSQQALEQGLLAAPDDAALRDRLEGFYSGRQMWRPLAHLLEREAERMGATALAVARLKNAAALYRDSLQDLDGAASALRKALAIVPDDLSLLGELARNLAAAGQHQAAIGDVTRLLDAHKDMSLGRVALLKVRAELRFATAELPAAVADLEEAYQIAPDETDALLINALERLRTDAFTRGDTAAERAAALRLVAIYDAAGADELAREALSGWVEQNPDDAAALVELRLRDEAKGRWDEVARSCERLLALQSGQEQIATAIALADASAKAGTPGAAREGLERVHREHPLAAELRARLRTLYESVGEQRELAGILLADGYAEKNAAERVGLFQRAARLYLDLDDAASALGPLGEASKEKPDDAHTQLLMIDISIKLGRNQEAAKLLDTAIAAQKRKRSPELAQLYQRMAHMAAAQGQPDEQIKWLNQATEIDRKSAAIHAELADAALVQGDHELAMKALRAITMMDDPKPITRAMAFLRQAQIAMLRGDPRRAQHWARKAKSLDEGLTEVDAFLAEIEG